MCGDKSDAVVFLKSSIQSYSEQLDELQQRLSESAGSIVERVQARLQYEQVSGLIEDAARLLSQLGGG
jgi:outer membrane protein TolC